MSDAVTEVAALEASVGKRSDAMDLKVIDHLDESAQRWLAASPFLFAAFGDPEGIRITAAGDAPGFARALDDSRLSLPTASLDEPLLARVGQGFGALFLMPSIGETLRVNGRIAAVGSDSVEIAVEECYVHCAKALMRSDFWKAPAGTASPAAATSLLAASRFMALATIDSQGRADVSPKGDPAGALMQLQDGNVWYPDRPGNRRTDSFRNILVQPHVAAAALIPGSTRIATLTGTARISTDVAMRTRFTVTEKTPHIVTCIEQPLIEVRESAALARAKLWPAAAAPEDIDPAAMFVSHIKLSKTRGVAAQLARAALSAPGIMERGLQHDYKNNMY